MLDKILVVSLLVLLATGCSHDKNYPIRKTSVDRGYYSSVLQEVDQEIGRHAQDLKLRLKRLWVSEKLDWPEDVSGDIHYLIMEQGLSGEIYEYGLAFFSSYHQYENLLNLVAEWKKMEPESPETLHYEILALSGMHRSDEVQALLWQLLQSERKNPASMRFAAEQYLLMKDTAYAMYAFNLLYRCDSTGEPMLVDQYLPLLLATGYPQKARQILLSQPVDSSDIEKKVLLATTLYQLGEASEAHRMLRSYKNPDILKLRSEWFEQAEQWDSAISLVDERLQQDSSIALLLKKGELMERRGLFLGAYELYTSIWNEDTTNAIASERAQDVARKIAYLRRSNQPEAVRPVIEFKSKKATNK